MKSFLCTLFLGIILFSFGCATGQSLNNLKVGMSKEQVIQTLGNPDSTEAADSNVEVLKYDLANVSWAPISGGRSIYDVVLVNGRVAKYGKTSSYTNWHPENIRYPASSQPQYNTNIAPGVNTIKQIDYKCMDGCTSAGYNRQLCQSKCEY